MRDSGGNTDKDLTKEEKLLLEEYKIGLDVYYRSESEYSSRENFFILAESLLAVAVVQLFQLLNSERSGIRYILLIFCIIGLSLSLFWCLMQVRSHKLSFARLEKLKMIENGLPIFDFLRDVDKQAGKNYPHNWFIRILLPLLFLSLGWNIFAFI